MLADRLAHLVHADLAQIRPERACAAILEALESAPGAREHLLHEVVGLEQSARVRRKPRVKERAQRRTKPLEEPLERVALPGASAGEKVSRAGEVVLGAAHRSGLADRRRRPRGAGGGTARGGAPRREGSRADMTAILRPPGTRVQRETGRLAVVGGAPDARIVAPARPPLPPTRRHADERMILAFLIAAAVEAQSASRATSRSDAAPSTGATPLASGASNGPVSDELESARELVRAVNVARTAQRHDEARELTQRLAEILLSRPATEDDAPTIELLDQLARIALDLSLQRIERDAWRRVLAERTRRLGEEAELVQHLRENLASALSELGELDEAEALQRRVIEVYERAPPREPLELHAARLGLAGSLGRRGDLRGAQALVERVLAAPESELPLESGERLQARQYHLNVLNALGEADEACSAAKRLLEDAERVLSPSAHNLATTRTAVAQAFQRCGDAAGMARVLEKALAAIEGVFAEDDEILLNTKANLGVSHMSCGAYRDALPLVESVLSVRERTCPPGDPRLLEARASCALVRMGVGDLDGAATLLDPLFDASGATPALPDAAPGAALGNVLHTAAQLRLRQGDPLEARRLAELEVAARERQGFPPDHPAVIGARGVLAAATQELGDVPAACAILREGLRTCEAVLPDDALRVIDARQDLATALLGAGDVAGALELQRGVVVALERSRPQDALDLAEARNNLAVTMRLNGDADEAHEILEELVARRPIDPAGFDPVAVSAAGTLALSCLERGEISRARDLAVGALVSIERRSRGGDASAQSTRRTVCFVLAALGERDSLRRALERLADGLEQRLDATIGLAPREALEAAGAAREDLDVLDSFAASADVNGDLERRVFELAERLRAASRTAASSRALHTRSPELTHLVDELRDARAVIASAAAAARRDGIAVDESTPSRIELVRARDAIEARLLRAAERSGRGALTLRVETLARALPSCEALVTYRRGTEIALATVGSRWDATRVDRLVAHVLTRPEATGGAELARVDLGPIEPITRAVERWRAAIERPLEGAPVERTDLDERAAAVEVRRLVFDPLVAALGDVERIHVCLDDVLHLVALDALPLGDERPSGSMDETSRSPRPKARDGAELVGDRWRIVEELDLARFCLPEIARDAGSPRLVALGGVDYDEHDAASPVADANAAPTGPIVALADTARAHELDGNPSNANTRFDSARGIGGHAPLRVAWPALPESGVEARAVAELFERGFGRAPLVLEGAAASKSALADAVRDARFVHVATHGFSIEAAGSAPAQAGRFASLAPSTLCGLVLAGANGADGSTRGPGLLTAEELAGLDLGDCELAVFAACHTASGIRRAGQGVQSVRAALHAAGARATITSLWSVDDAAARALLLEFYSRVWIDGARFDDALWDAKRALRARGAPTCDWAGWVASGGS